MKKQFLVLATIAAAAITVVAVSCKRNIDAAPAFTPQATSAGNHLPAGLPREVISGVIRTNKTLTNDRIWVLDGKVYVDDGATLQIEEGTFVAGKKKSTTDSSSALIITRGSTITALGTEDNPVVFTSAEDCPQSGDWGGVVLLGEAPINRNDTTIEGINLPSVPAGVDVNYGGGGPCLGDSMDNSGVLTYVRIEYAGAIIAPNNELNGLTCGGVGAGTKLEHIEVVYGNDDAFEFFGGTVNAKWLIALAPDDDAFDFDFGYIGHIQYAISVLKPGLGYSSNPNGIESSSAPGGAITCRQTRPVISNMTVIGVSDAATETALPAPGLLNGAVFNTASSYTVRNSLFMGYPTGLALSGASAGDFEYNTVQAFTTLGTLSATNRGILNASANVSQINLGSLDICAPDFSPQSGSTLTSDAVSFAGLPVKPNPTSTTGFFDAVSYRGAVDEGDTWPVATWVKYDYPGFCVGCED